MNEYECYCDRCNGQGPPEPETPWYVFGWEAKAHKAQQEKRSCEDHYHMTVAAKDACKTPIRYPYEDEE